MLQVTRVGALLVGMLHLPTALRPQDADHLSLHIGSRRAYRCVRHIAPGYVCAVEGQGCFCQEGAIREAACVSPQSL